MQYISARKRLPEEEVSKLIRQIVSAVDYLHRMGIIHRSVPGLCHLYYVCQMPDTYNMLVMITMKNTCNKTEHINKQVKLFNLSLLTFTYHMFF